MPDFKSGDQVVIAVKWNDSCVPETDLGTFSVLRYKQNQLPSKSFTVQSVDVGKSMSTCKLKEVESDEYITKYYPNRSFNTVWFKKK